MAGVTETTLRMLGSNTTVAVTPATGTSPWVTTLTLSVAFLATGLVAGSIRMVLPGGGVGDGDGVGDCDGETEPVGVGVGVAIGVGVAATQVVTVPPTVVTGSPLP